MKPEDKIRQTGNCIKPYGDRQIRVTAGGYRIILNFPAKPEGSAVNDIKRMMLGGVAKM